MAAPDAPKPHSPPTSAPVSHGSGGAAGDDPPAFRYGAGLAGQIEAKWQDVWEKHATFHAPNPGEAGFEASRPKKFILDMFPYPSGVGLHVGHPLGYIATDIYARYLRMTGHNVLHAMGFDSFGLPAEQYAVATNTHPRVTTERNIATMRAQLRRLGLGHDAARSVSTTDPAFYKWTQWIFLQIYNSWYDGEEEGTEADKEGTKAPAAAGKLRHGGTQGKAKGRARPIGELVAEFESGKRPIKDAHGKADPRAWRDIPEDRRREIVDSYRLAYLAEVPVNWCPMLGTVLANEEVIDGKSERGGFPVYKRPLKQWMMRITAYAERLLADLDTVDWPEALKTMQRNWIGRSEGAYIDFDCSTRRIRVFTTRPDTLFGATYMVLSPEHEMIDHVMPEKFGGGAADKFTRAIFPGAEALVAANASPKELIAAYRAYAKSKSDDDRAAGKDKTGCFTGAYAVNPVNGARLPVFIADYVLAGYGTGAIMAVPGQDQRDWDFAKAFGLPIIRTVQPPEGFAGEAFTEDGPTINSGPLDGLRMDAAKAKMAARLEEIGRGKGTINYKLRDWLFSRQRYWGEPFPIVFDERGVAHDLPESMLPVLLPEVANFQPESSDDPDAPPRPPLARAKEWVNATLDLGDGRGARAFTRETNTMPNWAGSCWYYLRYLDPANGAALVGREAERYWMGGALGTPALRAGVSEAPAERIEATAHLNGNIDVPITADGFVGRDPYPPGIYGSASDLLVKRRFLPHLELPGATYFVSWKTLDDRVLNPEEQAIALDALRHFDGQHGRVYAAVVMSNHVHWLVRPYDGHRLGDLISGAKRFSARAMNMRTGAAGSVWVPECFDHIVRDDAFFGEFFRYIVRNPVEAGAAASPAEYPWLFVHPDVRTRDGLRFAAIRGKGESARPDGAPAQSPARRAGVPKASVDLYVGGVEHAVLHLLYARFWHKVLFDLGHVSTPEPFGRLFNQGYIQDYAFKNEAGFYVDAFKVTCADGSLFFDDKSKPGPYFFEGKPVSREYGKMGKSLKNAVAPDEVFADFGCDTLRVYEMSMGPLEASKPWNTRDIAGAHRFLQRVWRNLVDEKTGGVRVSDGPPSDAALVKLLHKTIAGVRKDMETLGFNTAVAKLIEFNNELTKRCGPDAGASKDGGQDVRPTKASPAVSRGIAEPLVLMLAPLAPHMAEELWQKLGHGTSLAFEPFPVADSALAADDEIEIPVQVLGKLRGKVVVPAGSDAATIEAAAKADPKIAEQLAGKTIKKVIVVPGKLVNFVVG